MNVCVFLWVIILIAISQLLILYLSLRQVNTVKAGNVLKYSPAKKWRVGGKLHYIKVKGVVVDVNPLEQLIVCGNSMRDYHINNGQTVFIELYDNNGRGSIKTHPVVVINITNAATDQSQYKLRKMISYADGYNQNWNKIYEVNHDRIHVSQEEFENVCKEKVRKMQQSGTVEERLIVSETYDEDMHAYRYSLHPVSTLYAKVRYVI